MKRVTLLVDDALPGDESLPAHTALHFAGDIAYVLTERVESVEDIPDPLPTEPGTVIEATVTAGLRTRLIRVVSTAHLDDEPNNWVAVDSDHGRWYADVDLSDWTVLLAGGAR